MTMRLARSSVFSSLAVFVLLAGTAANLAGQEPSDASSSAKQGEPAGQVYAQEKAPTLDPAGPTISLISAEPLFVMAAALNACGYDEGLSDSAPIRQFVRDEMNQAFEKSEKARQKRDALCLYIAQHRMTGTEQDIAQYISLSLYLTPPPALEVTADLTEMPPDATQVVEIMPILRDFAAAVDLHGIWLVAHRTYDEEADQLHDALSRMIVDTDVYLKMPAMSYSGSRFIVVIEPQLSPATVNARIYGTDYVVVVSPSKDGRIPMKDVRHTYLHYVIDPMLYSHSNAFDHEQPILKAIREAPLPYRFRSDAMALNIECLIKAIEARTMDTGVPEFKIPAGIDRSQLPRYEHERELYRQKVEAVRQAAVDHDMRQGFVLTQYFYTQMTQFEKSPASLKDSIGEIVYGMDVDAEAHQAKKMVFDPTADEDVLQRSKPRPLTGLDLAEEKLATGDAAGAIAIAQKTLATETDTADAARAHFILARADLLSVHPGESEDAAEKTVGEAISQFQKTLETSKDLRLLAWSHIYMGRVLDLECERDQAVAEYKEALQARDGQLDTRLAAEHGVKTAYVVGNHRCTDDADDDPSSGSPDTGTPDNGGAKPAAPAQQEAPKPQ